MPEDSKRLCNHAEYGKRERSRQLLLGALLLIYLCAARCQMRLVCPEAVLLLFNCFLTMALDLCDGA